jgi:hypothetical protein
MMEVVKEFTRREALVVHPHQVVLAARCIADGFDLDVVRQAGNDSYS